MGFARKLVEESSQVAPLHHLPVNHLAVFHYCDLYFAIFLLDKNGPFGGGAMQAFIGHSDGFSGAWINLPPCRALFHAAAESLLGGYEHKAAGESFPKAG